MNYTETLKYIFDLEHFGIKLGLDNIQDLLDGLGRPERNFPAIHVAGTNGKGSTCAYLTAILMAAGYKVGTYTSPHLVDYRERVTINDRLMPEADLVRWMERLRADVDRLRATYFEATTAVAFGYFAEQKVDIAVVEVGLGGRLDATNVITPKVAIITDIDLDHTRVLGDTLEKIAAEKAGIIKPNVPIVASSLTPSVQQVFRDVAAEKGAPLHLLAEQCQIYNVQLNSFGTLFDAYLNSDGFFDLTAGLIGSYQPRNAMTAFRAAQLLNEQGFAVTEAHIRHGLAHARWPARFQIIAHKPTIIIDGGHNPAGAKGFQQTFAQVFPDQKLTLIFSALDKKEPLEMLGYLAPLAEKIILTKMNTYRGGIDPYALRQQLPPDFLPPVEILPSVPAAIEHALAISPPTAIIGIVGSLYLAGEALQYFQAGRSV